MQETLIKAANLCREAANLLRTGETPEKQASEIADVMLLKGLIPTGERERYTQHLIANPEKIAGAKQVLASLPARVDAIGELSSYSVGTTKTADAMDSFMYND
ncbi:MAG: hypothetical protein PHY48_17825 [Candidatus Cloacimonetes bacterium]|nr:hypothetical protein [Candidatus Cloacimonadota bacterium]